MPDEIGFVFLSGPYRGKDYYEISDHISEARRWSANLARNGIPFFCPHLNSAHMEVIVPDVAEDFWLNMDLVILTHATAVLLIPGWRDSHGAKAEVEFAQKEGIAIYTHLMYDRLVSDWWERVTNV